MSARDLWRARYREARVMRREALDLPGYALAPADDVARARVNAARAVGCGWCPGHVRDVLRRTIYDPASLHDPDALAVMARGVPDTD